MVSGMKGVSSTPQMRVVSSRLYMTAGQPGAVGLHVLGQDPGGGLVDILVGPGDDLEDLGQGVLEGEAAPCCSS